jgi:hypothetical protein
MPQLHQYVAGEIPTEGSSRYFTGGDLRARFAPDGK